MEDHLNKEEIISLLAEYCRTTAIEEQDRYLFKVVLEPAAELTLTLGKTELEKIESQLASSLTHEETALYSDNSYEVIVREESPFPGRRLRGQEIDIKNEEAGLSYELSSASESYLVWMLNEIRQKLSPNTFSTMSIRSFLGDTSKLEDIFKTPFDYIRMSSFRLMTLKILSTKKIQPTQFSKLTHSLLFHIGYNLDVALVPQRLLDEITRRGRIRRMRRSRIEDLDPPRRQYSEDLVQHYLLAISTDNPVIEYLSYYHVLEHFFESIFNDDLIESIRSSITNPGFSYKRKKDIEQLISSIKRSIQIRNETITFSESEALRLCINKFVDIEELKQKLNSYDETLLDFYKKTKVDFSTGPEVDLNSNETDIVFKTLARRIYSTRNALVHSKDGEKSKYTPFKDDRSLVKEVPLIRFISEMVILKDSSVQ